MTNKQEVLQQKHKQLEQIKKTLKKEFFGIDAIIDQLVENLSSWYLFNELQERPLVINLWGMTGTGKTSLIIRLAELLDFSKKLFHFEMSDTYMYNTAGELQQIYQFYNGAPTMLMFDEFQHLRSKDEEGKQKENTLAQTIWKITDSGKFEYFPSFNFDSDDLRKIDLLKKALNQGVSVTNGEVVGQKDKFMGITKMNLLNDDNFYEESGRIKHRFKKALIDASATNQEILIENKRIRFISFEFLEDIVRYSSNQRISIGSLDEEFSQLNGKESLERLMKYIEESLAPKILDCCKSVIFVCGNLDDAYPMAQSLNPDIDADIIYEQSLEVDVIKIKDALSRFLRYEQVSRLGNTHLIYPALNSAAYRKIIENQLAQTAEKVSQKNEINLLFSDALKEAIYQEGVFPTQGVRPLLSSISQNINGKLGEIIGEIGLKGLPSTNIRWDYKENNFFIQYLDGKHKTLHEKEVKTSFSLTHLRQKNSGEKRVITAVHEAGHAVVYRVLFSDSPKLVVSSTASSTSAGFMIDQSHDYLSFEVSIKKLALLLGGYCAEKLTFGTESITSGSSSDLAKVSLLAAEMVNNWQMNRFKKSSIYKGSIYQNYMHDKPAVAEEAISEAFGVAESILKEYEKLHLAIADALIQQNHLSHDEMESIVEKVKPELQKGMKKDQGSNYYVHCFENKKSELSL